MSGIVGSKLNIRGSGLVGSLGTDGQHLLSAGAGKTNVFETAAGGGVCLQVVGMSKDDTTSYGTASWAAITGMTLAITPTKTSSKILVTVTCTFCMKDLGGAAKVMVDIEGGGYGDLLVGAAASSRTSCSWGLRGAGGGGTVHADYTTWMRTLSYLHTPTYDLTEAITYKVYWNATSGNTLYLNRLVDDSDDANYVRAASSMTAMEID